MCLDERLRLYGWRALFFGAGRGQPRSVGSVGALCAVCFGYGTTDCTCGSHDDSPGTCVKLTIDTGLDQRTIVSVIAQYYTPEEMGGKQICILANLQPLTIRGIESKGMILMAKQDEGKMRIVTLEERLSNGAMGRSIFAATTR